MILCSVLTSASFPSKKEFSSFFLMRMFVNKDGLQGLCCGHICVQSNRRYWVGGTVRVGVG